MRRSRTLAVLGFLAVLPWLPGMPDSVLGSANIGASYALVAVSLVLLTGWVGQISLGHAALVGVGAYTTGHLAAGFGVAAPLNLPFAAAAAGLVAALLGVVALRVRGLYLAVVTLVFSWMASEFLFRQHWFTSHDQIIDRPIGRQGAIPFFDLTDRRTFFVIAWAIVAIGVFLAANVRDSKTGRAFFAIRGSEMAAASLGIDVTRYKLLAFAISGAMAGAAGNLIMNDARVVTADQFTFNVSLFYLAIAAVGGLTSLGGAIASALVFAGLTEVFFRVRFLGGFLELTSSILLAVTVLGYRGGLAALGRRISAAIPPLPARLRVRLPVRRLFARRGKAAAPAAVPNGSSQQPDLAPFTVEEAPTSNGNGHDGTARRLALTAAREAPAGARESRPALIEAEHIVVRFGGLVAVDDVSLTVREGEIVGLIGPNGAGKTTLFNAIAGYNTPTAGTVRIYGNDVTRLPVHKRAEIGVARTFQQIQLFGQLSVYENLLVATHVHNPTGVLSHAFITDGSLEREREASDRVHEVLRQLDLDDLADRRVADLPFGVLRMIEVARALVTEFQLIMLDEPASGLDNTETDRLTEILRFVRSLGTSLLLIEHDVRMVTAVSDHMYVLDQGRLIADGPPDVVRNDRAVIAAYLGEPAKATVA